MTNIEIIFKGNTISLDESIKKQFAADFEIAVKAKMAEVKENYGDKMFDNIKCLTGHLQAMVKHSPEHLINIDLTDENGFSWASVGVLGWIGE